MVSGKYSALSGAVAREQAMSNVAANLANVNTTGFKKNKISFESVLRGQNQVSNAKGINYSRIRKIDTDFSQGAVRETGSQLDVAIMGEGLFKIQKGEQALYTRAGHFMLDNEGMLSTQDGFNVLDGGNQPIQLPNAGGKRIHIAETGTISINGIPSGNRLQVFSVNNEQELKQVGNTLFELDREGADQAMEDFRLIQGSLETSNVNMMEEMAQMINTQRKFEADLKILESYSTLGGKLDELGSIG